MHKTQNKPSAVLRSKIRNQLTIESTVNSLTKRFLNLIMYSTNDRNYYEKISINEFSFSNTLYLLAS